MHLFLNKKILFKSFNYFFKTIRLHWRIFFKDILIGEREKGGKRGEERRGGRGRLPAECRVQWGARSHDPRWWPEPSSGVEHSTNWTSQAPLTYFYLSKGRSVSSFFNGYIIFILWMYCSQFSQFLWMDTYRYLLCWTILNCRKIHSYLCGFSGDILRIHSQICNWRVKEAADSQCWYTFPHYFPEKPCWLTYFQHHILSFKFVKNNENPCI